MFGKLSWSLESPTKFDESIFKVSSVPFFIPGFNKLTFELDNFKFKVLFEPFYTNIVLKQNKVTIPFASSIMKNIVICLPRPRLPVKLIYCIAFGSVSSSYYLIKPIYIILQ